MPSVGLEAAGVFCYDQFVGYLFGIKSDLGIGEGCVIYSGV